MFAKSCYRTSVNVIAQSAISNVYHTHCQFHSHISTASKNELMAGCSSFNEYVNENEYDNGMGKPETLLKTVASKSTFYHKMLLYY